MKNKYIKANKISLLKMILKKAGLNEESKEIDDLSCYKEEDSRLAVFDFDGTLFRSPYKPAVWNGNSWWSDARSLNPPCVPEHPDISWWIEDTVSSARQAISDKDTYSVLLSGRPDKVFGGRLVSLLNDLNLRFDEVGFSNSNNTVLFKSKKIETILNKFKFINIVELWDDKENYLDKYESLINKINPNIKVIKHVVVAKSKKAECEEGNVNLVELPKKAAYIGIMLDPSSSEEIHSIYSPKYHNEYIDHITLVAKPSKEEIEEYKDLYGKRVNFKIVGIGEDNLAQAAVVKLDGIECKNKIPHITISTAKDTPPSYSNEMLNKGYEEVDGPILSGVLWFK